MDLAACPLAAGPFTPAERLCDWCGAPLAGRRTRWCSDSCSGAWSREHSWTDARAAALKRDGHRCVRCGSTGHAPPELVAWSRLVLCLCPRPTPERYLDWRRRVLPLPEGDGPYHDAWLAWRELETARAAPWVAALALLDAEARRHRLEVNHKHPVLGRHSQSGCHHHLDGLETLCHACHLDTTAAQRAAGLLTR